LVRAAGEGYASAANRCRNLPGMVGATGTAELASFQSATENGWKRRKLPTSSLISSSPLRSR